MQNFNDEDQNTLDQIQAELENPNPQPEPPATPETPGLDPRLQQAMEQQNKRQLYADLFRSFQQVVQGAAPNSGFKADYSMADALSKRASEPVEMYKTQIANESAAKKQKQDAEEHQMRMKESAMRQDDFQLKLEKSKLDFQDMEANRDPSSPQSKIAQDRVLEVQKKLGQPVNEAQIRSMSGEQLYKSFNYLQEDLVQHYKNLNNEAERAKDLQVSKNTLAAQEARMQMEDKRWAEGEKRRQAELERREDKDRQQERQQRITTARGMIKDDPRFKKVMEQSMEFDSVNELLGEAEKGNQQAVGALGTKLARAMGEVGVLTDTDVVRYVAGQSWGRKLQDWFAKGAKGELSADTIKGIKANLKVLKEKLNKDVNKVVSNSTSRMKAAYPDMAEEDIRGILGFGTMQPMPSENETVKMRGPDGKVRLIPKNKVEAAKKAGGELVE